MTDAELRDAAWKELEQTTVGWTRVATYPPDKLAKTHWGKGKALLDRIGEPPVPPPPVGDKLAWKPFGYQGGDPHNPDNFPGFQKVHMNESNRVFSGSGDLYVIADSKVSQPYFKGYRYVVALGVEIDQTNPNENGCSIHGITGGVHFEGWLQYGSGLRDGLGMSSGGSGGKKGATVQLQNYRTGPVKSVLPYHADCVQIWGSSIGGVEGGCGDFRTDRYTGLTDLQNLFLSNRDGALGDGDLRNTNLIGLGSDWHPQGAGVLLYKHQRADVTGRASVMRIGENVHMEQRPLPGYGPWTTPDNWVTPNARGCDWGGTPDPSREAKLGQDAQGQYVYWVNGADVTGRVRVGPPPGGDFVPASKVGLGYRSPGYV
jgi:hypothetical protein